MQCLRQYVESKPGRRAPADHFSVTPVWLGSELRVLTVLHGRFLDGPSHRSAGLSSVIFLALPASFNRVPPSERQEQEPGCCNAKNEGFFWVVHDGASRFFFFHIFSLSPRSDPLYGCRVRCNVLFNPSWCSSSTVSSISFRGGNRPRTGRPQICHSERPSLVSRCQLLESKPTKHRWLSFLSPA